MYALMIVLGFVVFVALFFAIFKFTFVKEGTAKVVLQFGAFHKVLLAKAGYAMDADGNIGPGEQRGFVFGGLRFVGIRFIHTIYSRTMQFQKSMPSGIKDYDVPGVSEFLARVDYPYALPFTECEDINNIPITGHATLLAHVDNLYNSLFATANFYETMVGLVLPVVRDCFEDYSFTQLKEEKRKQDLDKLLWQYLSDPAKNPQPGSNLSVINELWEKYGVKIVAFRIVLLDPPKDARDSSLKKWKAEMDRDAAKVIAEKEAEETEGRVIESVAKANGMSRKELEDIIATNPQIKGLPVSDGGLKEDFAHARDMLKRDRAGEGLEDIRIGNVDGAPLEPITGVIGALFGLKQRQGARRKRNGGGQGNQGQQGKKGGRKKRVEDMDDDDLLDQGVD